MSERISNLLAGAIGVLMHGEIDDEACRLWTMHDGRMLLRVDDPDMCKTIRDMLVRETVPGLTSDPADA